MERLFLIALLLMPLTGLAAQEVSPVKSEARTLKTRFRAGIGVTSSVGPAVGYSVSASLGHHQISLYTLKAKDLEISSDERDPTKKMSDWGILYGRIWKLEKGWIAVSAGLNKVRGTLHGKLLRSGFGRRFLGRTSYYWADYEERPLDVIGIPMVVELGLLDGDDGVFLYEVTLYGFGNYNSEQPYGGLLFSLSVTPSEL